MALIKATLKASIKAAFDAAKIQEENQDAVLDQLCTAIADAVDAYIKSATITVTGVCATPSGPGTITGTGTMS